MEYIQTPRTLKVSDFLDAVDKNGFLWTKGDYSKQEYDPETGETKLGFCVMSQAGINLGLAGDGTREISDHEMETLARISYSLRDLMRENSPDDYYSTKSPVGYNDEVAVSYDDVKQYLHSKLDKYRNRIINFVQFTPKEEENAEND